jgi:uncharacterized protein with PIN domain
MTDEGPGGERPDAVRPRTDRLLLDVMLGKLAVHLRTCGYDAAYAGDRDIEADARIRGAADSEDRLLLTRDRQLAAAADSAILLTARDVEAQLAELREAGVRLAVADEPVRCGRCNGPLEAVDDDAETPGYAPDPAATDCWRCRDCGQVFWKGSHHERMAEKLD